MFVSIGTKIRYTTMPPQDVARRSKALLHVDDLPYRHDGQPRETAGSQKQREPRRKRTLEVVCRRTVPRGRGRRQIRRCGRCRWKKSARRRARVSTWRLGCVPRPRPPGLRRYHRDRVRGFGLLELRDQPLDPHG